jgi:hypothetical protein
MKKKFLLMIALVFAVATGFAQLSTRESDPSHEKIGTRPEKGDMALNFVYDLAGTNTAASFDIGNSLNISDMLTFKYYLSDKLVLRTGIRLYSNNSRSAGTALDDTNHFLAPTDVKENKLVSGDRQYTIALGLEKHYAASNIFDVYGGVDLFLGFGKSKAYYDYTYKNGNIRNTDYSTPNTTIGLGGLVGFNLFVAQLPIAVGLEYGLNAKWAWAGKTTVNYEEKTSTSSYSVKYYTQDTDPFGGSDMTDYKKLKKRQFNMDTNHDLRLVLNIYFSR